VKVRAKSWLAVAGLLILFSLLVFSVGIKSPTMDEQNHLARGLAYLRTGDLRLSQEHPPGVNAWEAWPLLLDSRVRLPLDSPSWADAEWYGFADQLLWQANDHPQAMIWATRVPVMWLSCLLAALAYRWARELGGGWAGLLALSLAVFDPNLLAHGRLTTTDMGVTVLSLAAMRGLWRAVRQGRWRDWALAGVLFGVVQLAKFSALALGPVVLLVAAAGWWRAWRQAGAPAVPSLCCWVLRLALLFVVGGLVVWAGYRFSWGPIPELGGLPGPAPAYWSGIEAILRRTGGGSPAFLMGQISRQGWWYYHPLAFLLKTPVPTLALLLAALWMWARAAFRRRGSLDQPGQASAYASLCLLLPVAAYWAMALGSSFDIGYRHILPALPLLYVWAGWQVGAGIGAPARGLGEGLLRGARWRPALVGGLVAWLVAGTLALAPHYLASFNALAGGPDGGYRFLVDSNLDWGQDLPGLVRYVEAEGIERVYLSWFGAAHPEAYGLSFHPLPGYWRYGGDPAAYGYNPYAPAAGTYAISASNLQGVALDDPDLYAWFRKQAPVARIGHSILIYEVDGGAGERQAVVLGVPTAELAAPERAMLARGASVRSYDPASGIILPRAYAADETWYAAPEAPEDALRLRDGPGYVVYQLPSSRPNGGTAEAQFGEHVRMLEHEVAAERKPSGIAMSVDVAWQVLAPPQRAAKTFAHLLDENGRYVAGWDGLAAPSTCWEAGDEVRQRYSFVAPSELPPGSYRIEVGWYNVETQERWPCYVGGERIGDRFLLEEGAVSW
jgi:hypothetical protein